MKLFVGKNCMPCKMLKEWLSENNITVNQLVADENMEEARTLGIKALPSLVLDDNKIIQGYEPIKNYFSGEEDE